MNTRMFSGRPNSNRSSQSSTVSPVTTSAIRRFCSRPTEEQPVSVQLKRRRINALSQSEQSALLRQQAFANAKRGHYAKAIALFSALISHEPASASNYNNRGLMHFQSGQPKQALADYNRAIQLNPRLAKVYNNRANCYASIGELDKAIADYETAIDINPANIHAWINQGITFRDLGLYEQAIENFELALQVSQLLLSSDAVQPSNLLRGHVYAERGRAHHLAGDWNCAVADYRRALVELPAAGSAIADVSCRLRSHVEEWLNTLLSPTLG